MYDTLLFLHVLFAFALFVTVVASSAYVLGSPLGRAGSHVSNLLWDIGGLGTLVLGVWLALYVDGYGIFDGWVLIAIVLWLAATGVGSQLRIAPAAEGGAGVAASAPDPRFARMHWVRTAIVVLLLLDMIYKPGA
jgi:hypothetical protein